VQNLFQPANVTGPGFTHPDPNALACAFPAGGGWNSGDLTADAGGTSQLVAEGYRLQPVSGYSTRGQDHLAAIWMKFTPRR
jgi:hypothetical protein